MPNKLVHIHDPAAEADIKRIRRAIEKLNDSLQSIRSLRSTAAGMQGLTATAIVNKCSILETKISGLIQTLDWTCREIHRVTEGYHEIDNSVVRM